MFYTQEKKPDIKGSARHFFSSKSACKSSAFEWTERPNVQCWPTGLLERAEPPFSRPAGSGLPGRLFFAGPVGSNYSLSSNRSGSKKPGFWSPPGFWPAKPALCTALPPKRNGLLSRYSLVSNNIESAKNTRGRKCSGPKLISKNFAFSDPKRQNFSVLRRRKLFEEGLLY